MVSPLLSESQSVSTYCDTIYGESNYIVRTTINVLDSARLVSSYCSIESKYYNENWRKNITKYYFQRIYNLAIVFI